ncbi:MAG: hypothetical protein ACREP9_23195 [Candidatus Dormibacteraceae bacterium]
MRRLAVVVPIVLIAAGCSAGGSEPSRASPSGQAISVSPPPDAAIVQGGCGATPVYKGYEPAWLDQAGAHNNPSGLPYVLAVDETAAGFIFGYPLRAGHPTNPSNKILWVVRLPRNGSSLAISGQLSGADAASVHESEPANSGPGEIYPSIVDVPQSGCWRFDLLWAGHHAAAYLQYQ